MSTPTSNSVESTTMRTHRCGDLRVAHVGETVTLCGWVARRREHGEHLAFVDLRDYTGVVQCVVDNTADMRSEWVVQITGVVQRRPEGTVNANLATGDVELSDCRVVGTTAIIVATDEIEWSAGILRKLDQLVCPAGTSSSGRTSDLKIGFGSTSERVCCLFVEFEVGPLLDSRVRFVTRRSRSPEATIRFVPNLGGTSPTQMMDTPPK